MARAGGLSPTTMRHKLERRYAQHHLHFITCSSYRRLPCLDDSHKHVSFSKSCTPYAKSINSHRLVT